ncbi:glycosyltransferase [Rhodococcus koreensis]
MRTTPRCQHLLLADGPDISRGLAKYAEVQKLPAGTISRIRAVRQAEAQLRPDIIHAHSSWAGFYTRALRLDTPVVYQPHCFVFEDKSRKKSVRAIYKFAEHVLSRNSTVTVALSPREVQLAERLVGNRRPFGGSVVMVPNAPSIRDSISAPTRSSRGSVRVVSMIGRLCPQKDPQFFIDVVANLRVRRPEMHFRWIGDGDPGLRERLTQSGVQVTGWLGSDELVAELARADVYVHSASYEGFPLSVLDAAQLRVPIVARRIPCFDGTGLLMGDTSMDVARHVLDVMDNDEYASDVIAMGTALLEKMNEDQQSVAIDDAYRLTFGRNTLKVTL